MMLTRVGASAIAIALLAPNVSAQTVTKYVRYEAGGRTSYGLLDGETVRELQGSIFDNAKPTGRAMKLADVKLLPPVEPRKVIAAGFNYKSHLGDQPAAKSVGLFAKYPTCIVGHGADIVYPPTRPTCTTRRRWSW
jgi:2-keto-4-pentenoate hydratase/2-oxohepta-3-ene-1,7-dioic acid hydratase in catechol pathway